MDKTQDGVPEEMLERANDLLGDLQAVVKGRFGNRLSDDDLTVVLNALSGVSGFYLSALSPQIVAEFNFSVLHHYCRARAQGVCTVMPTKLDG